MSYRPAFDCLWCGAPWTTRGPNDLEGWAQLCPACLDRAGSNPFLRGRLRRALASRVGADQAVSAAAAAGEHGRRTGPTDGGPARGGAGRGGTPGPTGAATPRRAVTHRAFPDDWFLRRGAFEQGAIHDAAWAAELDMVTRWLDGLALAGRILEPAAGVGFFSPLLAERGELYASDPDGEALDRARDRLVAHHLRAHLHVADPWSPPEPGAPGQPAASGADGAADWLVAAFLLGRVRGAGLDNAAAALRDRLRPGGRLALLELLPDAAGGPPPGVTWTWHDPALVEAALRRAGFAGLEPAATGRFFLTMTAVAR